MLIFLTYLLYKRTNTKKYYSNKWVNEQYQYALINMNVSKLARDVVLIITELHVLLEKNSKFIANLW